MVDIRLNLKKTATIQEIDGWALICSIDYCDENESWPGYGRNAIVINGSEYKTLN